MILLTVGTQLPFDRLIEIVDQWAQKTSQKIIAQVGESHYQSDHITVVKYLTPSEFDQYIRDCDFIISHAGMGSILTALKYKKPIVIFPRKASLGEHRNDHQLSTTRSFQNTPGVYVAFNEHDLLEILQKSNTFTAGELVESSDYHLLKENVKNLILV